MGESGKKKHKRTGVRGRQSSSDNGRPPAKKWASDRVFNDEDDSEYMSEQSCGDEGTEEANELVNKLVKLIEDAGGSKSMGRPTGSGFVKKAKPEAVKAKVNAAKSQVQKDTVSTPTASQSATLSTSQSQDIDICGIIEQTVQKALTSIVPVLKDIIKETVDEKTKQIEKELDNLRAQVQRNRVLGVLEADKAEQYSRRDNLVITGIVEEDEENTDTLIEKVLLVCENIEAKVKKEDITAIHRLGKVRADKNRPVIIKTTRIAKQEITKKKKSLKSNTAIQGNTKFEDKVYINEDMTEPRRKLLSFIRASGKVNYCFFREGTIVCKKGERFIHVHDADDLFKLEIDDEDYNRFYDIK